MKELFQGNEHWALLLVFLLVVISGFGLYSILKLKNHTAGSTTPRWDARIFELLSNEQ